MKADEILLIIANKLKANNCRSTGDFTTDLQTLMNNQFARGMRKGFECATANKENVVSSPEPVVTKSVHIKNTKPAPSLDAEANTDRLLNGIADQLERAMAGFKSHRIN